MEMDTYHWRFERNFSREETLQQLRGTWPSIQAEEVSETERKIEGRLNPEQRWILSVRNHALATTTIANEEEEPGLSEIADPGPSPESAVGDQEQRAILQKCLRALAADERLILRLRFDDELSLEEIARLMGLGDAQRAHRRLVFVLQRLRSAIARGPTGKSGAVSVK